MLRRWECDLELRSFKREQLTPIVNRQNEVFEKRVTDVDAPRLLISADSFDER